jgi:hypothetical protein
MAGLGRKVFTAGEVLTSANVNGYLMDQSVMVFEDVTARSSAIPTPSEGMVAYLKDTDALQVYGTAWADVAPAAVVPTLTSSTATAYAIDSADQGNYLRFTAGAGTITVGTATGFTEGQQVQIITEGTAWSILPEGTAVELYGRGTAQGTAGFLAESPYDAFSIISVGTNAYRIIGNVSAV